MISVKLFFTVAVLITVSGCSEGKDLQKRLYSNQVVGYLVNVTQKTSDFITELLTATGNYVGGITQFAIKKEFPSGDPPKLPKTDDKNDEGKEATKADSKNDEGKETPKTENKDEGGKPAKTDSKNGGEKESPKTENKDEGGKPPKTENKDEGEKLSPKTEIKDKDGKESTKP